MSERIVIVGAGPAGLSAAEAYREAGGRGTVTILGDDRDAPYERPALSKDFLRGRVGRDALAMRPPSFYDESAVDLRTSCRAVGLDTDAGSIEDDRGERHRFDRCLLATGARPLVPEVDGVSGPRVHTLRKVEDAERLRDQPPGRAVVVGSGFIGCEIAASLASRAHRVTVVTLEEGPRADRLGSEVSRRVATWLEELGVVIRVGAELQRIDGAEELRVEAGGQWMAADLVVIALGVLRNTELAADAGLELQSGAVRTDSRLASSADGVLAAGDVAIADNGSAGRPLLVEHWGEALAQGSVAGAVMAGDRDLEWAGVPGFWSTIGKRTIKHVAWGDGFDEVSFEEGDGGAFVATYTRDRETVGVLTHEADDAYQAGRELLEGKAPTR